MCVGFWSLDHPEYALVLCTNRDEYLARPTAPAHFHDFGPVEQRPSGTGHVLSGRDIVAGGTWLGITRSGHFAMLTNITEPYRTLPSSRGHLVSRFLRRPSEAQSFSDQLTHFASEKEPYAGFNLLLLSPKSSAQDAFIAYEAGYVTNHGVGGKIAARRLSADEVHCGGMSNGIEGQGDVWPKVQVGIRALDQAVLLSAGELEGEEDLISRLFNLLTWKSAETPQDRAQLRNTIMIDPIPLPPKPGAAAKAPEYYGTRLATIILVSRRTGLATFVERDVWTLGTDGRPVMSEIPIERRFKFLLEPNSCADMSA